MPAVSCTQRLRTSEDGRAGAAAVVARSSVIGCVIRSWRGSGRKVTGEADYRTRGVPVNRLGGSVKPQTEMWRVPRATRLAAVPFDRLHSRRRKGPVGRCCGPHSAPPGCVAPSSRSGGKESVKGVTRTASGPRSAGNGVQSPARPSALSTAIDRAVSALYRIQKDDGHWVGELQGDTILESEFLFLMAFLGREREEKCLKAARYILTQQQPHGAWSNYAGGPPDLSVS